MAQGAARGMERPTRFVIEGVEFVPSWGRPSQPGSLTLLKANRMVPLYRDLLAPFPTPRMVELGISQGGSVALLALLAQPTKFVAIELAEEPIGPLQQMIDEKGLADRIRPYFGVDQGDKARLTKILDEEFGDEALDVVIDDASHLYGPTVASFEVLFPRLRPGGLYVIEDWNWQDLLAKGIATKLADPTAEGHEELKASISRTVDLRVPKEVPLSRMAVELALARAHAHGAVDEVHLDENWIVVRKGHQELDLATTRITDLFADAHELLVRSDADLPGAGG